MSDIANEQDILEDGAELTDAQLDAEFDADDGDMDSADKGMLTLGDDDDGAGAGGDADEAAAAEAARVAAEGKPKADAAAAVNPEVKKPDTVAKAEPTAQERAEQAQRAKEAAQATSKQFMDSMIESLKDVEIGDGGTDDSPMPKTFGEFAEQYPEIATVTQKMIEHLREELLSRMQPIQQLIQTQEITSAQQALAAELASDDYGHPDAGNIIGSDAFEAWAAKQTPAFQKFIDSATSAQDAAAILSKYKSDTGTKTTSAAQQAAEKQRAAKAARDRLHSASTRTRKAVHRTSAGGTSEEDLDAAFDEDDGDEV